MIIIQRKNLSKNNNYTIKQNGKVNVSCFNTISIIIKRSVFTNTSLELSTLQKEEEVKILEQTLEQNLKELQEHTRKVREETESGLKGYSEIIKNKKNNKGKDKDLSDDTITEKEDLQKPKIEIISSNVLEISEKYPILNQPSSRVAFTEKKVNKEDNGFESNSTSTWDAITESPVASSSKAKIESSINISDVQQVSKLLSDVDAFVKNVDTKVRLATEVIESNLKARKINLEKTAEQRQRWENIKKRLKEYLNSLNNPGRIIMWMGALTAVGTLGWYVVSYRQLPLFGNLLSPLLSNIGSASNIGSNNLATPAPITVNVTLPPTPVTTAPDIRQGGISEFITPQGILSFLAVAAPIVIEVIRWIKKK